MCQCERNREPWPESEDQKTTCGIQFSPSIMICSSGSRLSPRRSSKGNAAVPWSISPRLQSLCTPHSWLYKRQSQG